MCSQPAHPGTDRRAADARPGRRSPSEIALLQARAHRALAALVEKETRLHARLKELAEQSAGDQTQAWSARILRWLGQKHVEQEEMGRMEIRAHHRLADWSEARAAGAADGPPRQGDIDPEEARLILVEHAELAEREVTGRARDATLARLALARLQRKRAGDGPGKPVARRPEDGRARRMQDSARLHGMMSSILSGQARAHRLLATLARREAEAGGPSGSPAREARQDGAPQVGAHRRLAARSEARALWHESCAAYISESLAPGAPPSRQRDSDPSTE